MSTRPCGACVSPLTHAPAQNNPMFPQGVVYEGVEEFGGKPQTFSGESGANDSLVPTGDNFLEITSQFPKNEVSRL